MKRCNQAQRIAASLRHRLNCAVTSRALLDLHGKMLMAADDELRARAVPTVMLFGERLSWMLSGQRFTLAARANSVHGTWVGVPREDV
ncbi:hypothetical protein [Deinococcus sonorensis]|uniref:Uncharacterized protein n=2 Tax=Deinococcus sonorensis TaxID=309891 RepID=A0AAU7UG40_9DEIO